MRKYEKEICAMKTKGFSNTEIGKILGISKQYVGDVYRNYLEREKRNFFTEKQYCIINRIKYKAISKFIYENQMTVKGLCDRCGEEYSTAYGMGAFLFGENSGKIEYIKEILQVTGLTFEEAFRDELTN